MDVLGGKPWQEPYAQELLAQTTTVAKPNIVVDVGPSMTSIDGNLYRSVELTLKNLGEPFTLVTEARLIGDSRGGVASAPWHYVERSVKGGHGPSSFCIATLGEIEISGIKHWLVKARGEGNEPRGRWHGPGDFSADIEWTFHIDVAGTLNPLATVVTRVIVDSKGFRVEKRDPSSDSLNSKAKIADIVKELTSQVHFATHTLLHAKLGSAWTIETLRERISLWEQDVLAVLEKAGASEVDKSEFQYLITFTPRGLGGSSPKHARTRENLAEQIHRLRAITRRLEEKLAA
jgi:hypothetical protein